MGRKNRRIQTTPDRNFIKFMESINKRNRDVVPVKKTRQYDSIEDRNRDRLNYAIEQFQRERIQYEVLNEEKGVAKVYHQSTGDEYIFYASTGTLRGVENLRGLRNVLEFLYT